MQGKDVRGCEVFPDLRGEGLGKTSHTLWEGTENMEPVFFQVHGNWSGVNGHKLEKGNSPMGMEIFLP